MWEVLEVQYSYKAFAVNPLNNIYLFKGDDVQCGEAAIDEVGLEGLFYEESSDGDEDSDDEDDDGDDDDGVIDELRDFEEEEDVDNDEEDEDKVDQDDDDEDENLDAENPIDFSFYSTASSHSPLRPSRRQKKSYLFYTAPTATAKANRSNTNTNTIPVSHRVQSTAEDLSGEYQAPLWRILQNWERTHLSVYSSPSPDKCNSGQGSNDRELSSAAKIADISELYGDKSTEFKNRMAFMHFEGVNLSALISHEQIIRTIELYKKILRLPIESAKSIGGNSSHSVHQKADPASSDMPVVDNTSSLQKASIDIDATDNKAGPLQDIGEIDQSIPTIDLPTAVSSEDVPKELPSHLVPVPPPTTLLPPPDSKVGNEHGDESTNAPQSSSNPTKHKLSLTIDVNKKVGAVKVVDNDGFNDIHNPGKQKEFPPYNQFSNIVGALTLPLSLVGPLKFSFLVKSYRFQRKETSVVALNEEMEKHLNRTEKQVDTYAWLPLATLDKNIVDNLQFAVNCLNDMSLLPGRKSRESTSTSNLGTMMVSKLYPPIRRKAIVSVRVVFDSCDHAVAFHTLCVQQRQSSKDGGLDEKDGKDDKEYEDSISVIDGISSILEENVVLLQLSLATSMTSYVSEDSLIYRYCDFPSCQPIDVVSSEDINNSGILLAGNYSLQHLLDKGRQILLRYIERIRATSTKSKSLGLSSMKMNFFDESNPSPSFSTSDGYRSAPVMGFRNHCSHYVSTTVSITTRVAGLLGFTSNEVLLQASEKSLLYDRSLIDKYLHRILCALFTSLNTDVSVIPNILANFHICHSLVACGGEEWKERGGDAAAAGDEAGQRCVRVGVEHQRLDLCLFIPVMFGDREVMSFLRTDTAAPDSNTDLCLNLLLDNIYSDIGNQVLFPVADEKATDLNESDGSAHKQCTYLPDSDSIFGRAISGSILLAYLAYLQKSYRRI